MSYFSENPNCYGPACSPRPTKSRVFVSYHHGRDQLLYDAFVRCFSTICDVFTDRSLERQIDSDDTDYLRRAIRENNIAGSSVTIVLCGAETYKRRWVDWETQMTLNKQHALLGIALPVCARNQQGHYMVPDRLADNVYSAYAKWITWPSTPEALAAAIADARAMSLNTESLRNNRPAMQRSHP